MPKAYPKRLAGPAIGALAAAIALPAFAADLDYPYPGPGPVYREERIEEHGPPPPPPRPIYGPRFSAAPGYAPLRGACRTTVTRRVDFDGDEVERRVSVCDALPDHHPPLRPPFRPHLDGPDPLPPGALPDERW